MKTHHFLFQATNLLVILTVGVVLSRAEDKPAQKSSAVESPRQKVSFDFEQDTGGWENTWSTPYLTAVEVSAEQALSGKKSLKLSFDNPTDEQQVVNVVLPSPQNIEQGDTLVVHYWLPSESPVTALQPAFGSDSMPFSGQYTSELSRGEWKEIGFALPEDAGNIQHILVQSFLPPQTKGVFYLDDIAW